MRRLRILNYVLMILLCLAIADIAQITIQYFFKSWYMAAYVFEFQSLNAEDYERFRNIGTSIEWNLLNLPRLFRQTILAGAFITGILWIVKYKPPKKVVYTFTILLVLILWINASFPDYLSGINQFYESYLTTYREAVMNATAIDNTFPYVIIETVETEYRFDYVSFVDIAILTNILLDSFFSHELGFEMLSGMLGALVAFILIEAQVIRDIDVDEQQEEKELKRKLELIDSKLSILLKLERSKRMD